MIKKFLSGEITESEKKILFENSKSSPEIEKIINLHDQLQNPDVTYETPDENSFQKMREGTINKLYQYRENKLSLKLSSYPRLT